MQAKRVGDPGDGVPAGEAAVTPFERADSLAGQQRPLGEGLLCEARRHPVRPQEILERLVHQVVSPAGGVGSEHIGQG